MATTDPFFGPEIVDRPTLTGVVREHKAATAFLVGTAPVHLAHTDEEERAKYINKPIIIYQQSDIETYFGPSKSGYTIPQALKSIFRQMKNRGVGTIVVVNVFDPDVHKDDSDNPDPSQVTNVDIIGGFDTGGNPGGISHAYSMFYRFGWFPKILLAPGFANATGVATAMEAVANRINARFLWDAPIGTTVQQTLEARGPAGLYNWQTNNRRMNLLMPHMKEVDLDEDSPTYGELIPEPYSSTFAGVWLSSILEYGYHHSPSNRPIVTEDAQQEILYIPGDYQSDVQQLRGAGIICCEESWGKGIHTSGNRNAAYPTDTDQRNSLHALFITDMMDEAVLFFMDQWKDRNPTPASFDMQEDRINSFLNTKSTGSDPALYGGRFWFDREATTPELVADNWFKYQMPLQPVGVYERMTMERWINIEFSRNALQLAGSNGAPAGAAI